MSNVIKTENLIYGDLEKRKLPFDIIYRLQHHYRSELFLCKALPYCKLLLEVLKGSIENKINK